MNFFQKEIDSQVSQFVSLLGGKAYGRVSDADLWEKGYTANNIVYSVISNITNRLGSLPIQLMNNGEPVSDDDFVFKIYQDNWNENYGHEEGLRQIATHLLTFGVCYIQKVKNSLLPDELFILPNHQVQRELSIISYYENPKYYWFSDGVKRIKIPTEDLIIIRLPQDLANKSRYDGLSPLQSVWSTVLASNNRQLAEEKIYENRGVSGIVTPKATRETNRIPETIFNSLQEKLKGIFGGAEKANKIVTVDSSVDFVQLGMSPSDLKLIESRSGHIKDICNAYNFPAQLLGDKETNQHSNYDLALKSAYTDVIIPLAELIIGGLDKHWLNEINGLTGKGYYLHINKGKIEAITESWTTKLTNLPNEIQQRIIATLTDKDIEEIKNEIGLNYEQ